jgi:hypothetical protein
MKQSIKILVLSLLAFSPFTLCAQSKKCGSKERGSKEHHLEVNVGFSKAKMENGSFIIVLSDGTRWEVVKTKTDFKKIQEEWKAGDDIHIESRHPSRDGLFRLKNARTKDSCTVRLQKELESGSRPITISKIDKNGYSIVTSDGRQWSIGWLGSFTSSEWRVGDPLHINKSFFNQRNQDYYIINLRDPKQKEVWATLVRW